MQGRVQRGQFGAPGPAMRAWGYTGKKDGLPLLYLSYHREKRALFTVRGQQRSLSWFLLFPGEGGITMLGILILAPVTSSLAPGPALTRSGLLHPGRLSPDLGGLHTNPSPLAASRPPPSLLRAPSLPGAHPLSLAPSFLRTRPPSLGTPSLLRALPPAPRSRQSASRPCAQACPAPSPPPARALAPASPSGGLACSQAGPVPGTGTGPSGAAAPVLPRQPGRLADRSCARIYLAPPRSTREGEYAAAGLWGPAAEGGERRGCRGGRSSSLALRLGEVVGPGTWMPRCTGSMWGGHSPGELGPFSWTRFSREAWFVSLSWSEQTGQSSGKFLIPTPVALAPRLNRCPLPLASSEVQGMWAGFARGDKLCRVSLVLELQGR